MRAGVEGEERFLAAVGARMDLDPMALLEFAKAQQLRPWMGFCASGAGARAVFPEWLIDDLRQARLENAARVERLIEQSRTVSAAFDAAGIDCLFLKGLTHGRCLHGEPARRFQTDIDLLVGRNDVRRSVEVLASLGYDTTVHAATGQPLSLRVDAMLGVAPGRKVRNSCTVQRGPGERLDLHWCIRVCYERAVGGEVLWRDRRSVDVGGLSLPTVSEENMLLVLLLNIAADLRTSRCRAKLFLDLYLACRSVERDGSWKGFFARRREQGIERLVVNVLALLVSLWDCGAELPELRRTLLARAELIETRTPEEALRIVTRLRDDPANRRWHERIHPSSGGAVLRFVREPRHSWTRLRRPRQGAALLTGA